MDMQCVCVEAGAITLHAVGTVCENKDWRGLISFVTQNPWFFPRPLWGLLNEFHPKV
jgi:hypothetical protein